MQPHWQASREGHPTTLRLRSGPHLQSGKALPNLARPQEKESSHPGEHPSNGSAGRTKPVVRPTMRRSAPASLACSMPNLLAHRVQDTPSRPNGRPAFQDCGTAAGGKPLCRPEMVYTRTVNQSSSKAAGFASMATEGPVSGSGRTAILFTALLCLARNSSMSPNSRARMGQAATH